jgi:subtilisin-like proprotein convertase family protein
MKKLILLAVLHLAASVPAPAISFTYNSGFDNGVNILDGNVNPWSDTRTVSGTAGLTITDVSVRLNLSGGYNGDLYGYLSYNGTTLILLNRVGVGTGSEPTFSFGYAGAGFSSLLLQDVASDIHSYGGGVGTGTYSPDGRDVSPLSSPSVLYATGRDTFSGKFGGMNPNGEWTLVLADVSAGGGQAHVVSWGLDINQAGEAVPESLNMALGVFAAVVLLVLGERAWRARSQARVVK